MKVLIIGGTGFLGSHLTLSALRHRHDVTLLHRGQHPRPAAAQSIHEFLGDRLDQATLDRAAGERWDAVIDTTCYFPRAARTAVSALGEVTARYVLISTVSVYTDDSAPFAAENWPLASIPDESVEDVDSNTYGALKVLSEVEVTSRLAGRAYIIRPGLIVGPGDRTDRFTYWCRRLQRGGDVLVPGPPEMPVQYIDARDLADWTVRLAGTEQAGVFNATGPAGALTMAGLVDGISEAIHTGSRFHWVDPDFLLGQGVEPWSDLPVWAPASLRNMTFDNTRAVRAGLSHRPLADTVRDTLVWSAGRPMPGEAGPPGLSADREADLLTIWSARAVTRP